jgi:hypothetical protein
MDSASLELTDVFNIRDDASPVKTCVIDCKRTKKLASRFTLWLTGLGITHELARSAQENGCAERFNRTWYERVVAGQTFQDYAEHQSASDRERERRSNVWRSRD